MRLEVFLVLSLVALCLGQGEDNAQRSSRAPQGQLQYNDPDGYRISWKLYSPSQWTSQLENPQPSESRAEQETVPETKAAKPQEAAPVEEKQQPQIQQTVDYKPYSMVPVHIKQLISRMYEPQGPYVDPKVYIYHTPGQTESEDQSRSAAVQSDQYEQKADRRQESVSAQEEGSQQKYAAHEQQIVNQEEVQQRSAPTTQQHSIQDASRYQQQDGYLVSGYQNPLLLKRKVQYSYGKYPLKEGGLIEYKEENSESKPAQYGFVPQLERSAPQPEQPTAESVQYAQEKNMPSPIQQLLTLQAQTPYYVFANRITYKPKKMFIPKPISEDDKGVHTYRNKVYYMRDDEDQENKAEEKPVEEVQRH